MKRAGRSLACARDTAASPRSKLADIDWIRDAAGEGEVLLTGDKAIAKRPLEVRAVVAASARMFALASNQLTGGEKAQRFLDQEQKILKRIAEGSGPYVISVTGHGLAALKLFE
ncbi:MAG: hypothetical protein ABI435_05580 [Pseudolysinimonas sp.]